MKIAVIEGDGIGADVTNSTIDVVNEAITKTGAPRLHYEVIEAGAGYYAKTGHDIEPDGEERAGAADAIFLGAIGLPSVRHKDGTEIAPHLRLRDRFGLYAGVRPVKAYPNSPQRLSDPRAASIDMVILRESTEGLFYSAAAHGRSQVIGDSEVRDTLRITRATTERLHRFGFRLAQRRKAKGSRGRLTCVDKANVFASMAFFRKIFDEIAGDYPDIEADHAYVDAQALNLIRNESASPREARISMVRSATAGRASPNRSAISVSETRSQSIANPRGSSGVDRLGRPGLCRDRAWRNAAFFRGSLRDMGRGRLRGLRECKPHERRTAEHHRFCRAACGPCALGARPRFRE